MTKATSFAIFALFMLSVFALTPRNLRAQTPLPLNDNPGTECLEYRLDIGTLKTNNLQIFWKQKDCIRITVVNNPFRYVYKLTLDETKIAEDDVLGSLGSLLGLKTINNTPAGNAAPKTPTPAPIKPGPAPDLKALVATPKLCDAQQQQAINALADSIDGLEARTSAVESSLKSLDTEPRKLAAGLDQKETAYRNFQLDYLAKRAFLRDQATDVNLVKQAALRLQTDSLNISYSLTGDTAFEGEMVDDFETARLRSSDFADLSRKATDLSGRISGAPTCTRQKKEDADRSSLDTRVKNLQTRIDNDVENLRNYASQIANLACRYKTRKEGEFSWVFDQVYQPVSEVLANPVAFGSSVDREGPFADPTLVSVTLKRDAIIDQSVTSIPQADDSILECSTDPSTVLQSNKSFSTFADLPVSPPKAQSGSTKAGGAKAQPSTSDANKTLATKTLEASTVVFQQPWLFGKARLVLSGGLATGFLVKQEFQRSASISGTGSSATSPTVIGLKTDTRFRLTPMLYGHTLLGSTRHEGDAWYATLGVTANSDNKGTDPEFLLGASRSFAQQRFFFTLGAYIGERQKLDGGLHVGQTIPSTLTGELPVTKSYHASWGFSISYRLTSTKNPQKNSSPSSKQSSGTPKKTGN